MNFLTSVFGGRPSDFPIASNHTAYPRTPTAERGQGTRLIVNDAQSKTRVSNELRSNTKFIPGGTQRFSKIAARERSSINRVNRGSTVIGFPEPFRPFWTRENSRRGYRAHVTCAAETFVCPSLNLLSYTADSPQKISLRSAVLLPRNRVPSGSPSDVRLKVYRDSSSTPVRFDTLTANLFAFRSS